MPHDEFEEERVRFQAEDIVRSAESENPEFEEKVKTVIRELRRIKSELSTSAIDDRSVSKRLN